MRDNRYEDPQAPTPARNIGEDQYGAESERAESAVDLARPKRQAGEDERTIDASQAASASRREWFKDPPIVIAILALVVSIISPVIAQRNIASDRERQDQERLANLISELPDLREPEDVDERVLVAEAATAIMDRASSTPVQKFQIADAWASTGNLFSARELLQAAMREADEPYEKTVTERVLAHVEFQLGNFDAGRAGYERLIEYQRAELPAIVQPSFIAEDEILWGNDELFLAKDCKSAQEHMGRAAQLAGQETSQPDPGLQEQLERLRSDVADRCG